MFGGFGKKSSFDDSPKQPTDDLKKAEKLQASQGLSFDPDSLERAAKAARELDSSKNAQGG
jgi:hypothetical protein